MTSLLLESCIQRADDFILQKIHKLEQRRHGGEYNDLSRIQPRYEQTLQRAWSSNDLSLRNPPAQVEYRQEFDQRSQRWYYLDPVTGRAQWSAPSNSNRYQDQGAGPRGRGLQDDQYANRPQECGITHDRSRERTVSQPPRPELKELDVPHQQPRPISVSPHPSPLGRLPPGAFLDMRTRRLVTNMYPPDHPINAR
jgi:hypothetical protein